MSNPFKQELGQKRYRVDYESSWVRIWANNPEDAILVAESVPFGEWETGSDVAYKVMEDDC